MFLARCHVRLLAGSVGLVGLMMGCAARYDGVVKPVPRLSVLSPELEKLTDEAIETYLRADVRPVFPTVLAVAKVAAPRGYRYDARWGWRDSGDGTTAGELQVPHGEEGQGWRTFAGGTGDGERLLVEQVHIVTPMLAGGVATLKALRDAAALLHAPLLLVYMQDDAAHQGYNSAAMAYWTILGLFVVPGHTVGHYSACQGLLVDTRSGFILASVDGEAKCEENVLPGAVEIAQQRVDRAARAAAAAEFQANAWKTMQHLARTRGVWQAPP